MTGSHSIKAGFTLMHSWRYNTQEPNNSVTLSVRGTQPFSLTQYATPIQFHETLRYNMGLFAQDQWRINRFTVNYGVRLDFLNARVDAQNIAAGPFTPARNFDAVENVPNWKDVDPRFGVVVGSVRRRQDGRQGQRRSICRRRVLHDRASASTRCSPA